MFIFSIEEDSLGRVKSLRVPCALGELAQRYRIVSVWTTDLYSGSIMYGDFVVYISRVLYSRDQWSEQNILFGKWR